MSSTIETPIYVYKILDSEPGEDLATLKLSPLDLEDGFIHLSTADQVCVQVTFQHIFVWLLRIIHTRNAWTRSIG